MSDKTMKNIPKLRFPKFKNEPEWINDTLDNLTDILRCGIAATPEYVDDGVIFLSSQNVTADGNFNLDKYKCISKEHYEKISKNAKLLKGDILYTRVGAGFGNATVFPFDGDYGVYVSLTHIRTNKKLNNYFLNYLLNAPICKNQAQDGVFQGGGVPNLNVKIVEKFKINYPSIAEQEKIANCLSSIDSLISTQNRKVEVLKEHKRGLIQNLMPKDNESIPKFRFPEFLNEKEWEEKSLKEILIKNSMKNKNGKYSLVQSVSNKYGFINQDEYFENRRVASNNTSNYYVIKKGYFAYNPSRIDVGSLAYKFDDETSIISPLYVSFKTNKEKINDIFLLHWFFSERFTNQMIFEGGVRNTLNYENLTQIRIKLPQIEEQQKIANCLTSIDEEIDLQIKKVESLKEHKKALLQQLFPSNEVING